ncbi:MAG: class B sortase [Peptostreptococcaceae bacterium]|nr:class B sortase [Peptostreptococcaceae bacterium]
MTKKRRTIILIVLGVIVICCAAFIINSKLASNRSEKAVDELKEKVVEKVDIPIDFEAAWDVNEDVIAWITIPNTTVDYPLLQSPDEDNYYVNHDLNKVENWIPGSIYINLTNSSDLTDNNTVIYGHNVHMASDNGQGTMFGDLQKFYDEEFFKENKEIIIYTPEHIYTYEIFAAVTYNNKLITALYDLDDKDGYQAFLDSLNNTNMARDNYTDKEVTVDDKIITLSTCTIDHDHDYRFLITAVLVDEQ